jgi:integrase
MPLWERVGENLVRQTSSKTLYLRARIGGKIIRRSLETTSVRIAKLKRDKLLLELRTQAGVQRSTGGPITRDEAIEAAKAHYAATPSYQKKPRSLDYRKELLKLLGETLPDKPVSQWSRADMVRWWGSPGVGKYSATRRNNALGTLRKVIELAMERNERMDDPTALLKRLPVKVEEVAIPSREDFRKVVADIGSQKKSHSKAAARFVEFLAFCGGRPGEVAGVEWEHVGKEHLLITGGEGGTKNHETRRVPIMAEMRRLLDEMRFEGATGPIFSMTPPKDAIKGACRRLKLPAYSPKTFRHVFGTTCLECGVPLATVSDWMGHKDKGVTLARTYAHIRDEHGLAEAAKVEF